MANEDKTKLKKDSKEEELLKKIAQNLVKEESEEDKEGIEKILKPDKRKIERFISKVREPERLSLANPALEQTVGFTSARMGEEEEKKKVEYEAKPYQPKTSEKIVPGAGVAEYIADPQSPLLRQFNPEGALTHSPTSQIRRDIPEHMRKAFESEVYSSVEKHQLSYQTEFDQIREARDTKAYNPLEKDEKERRKKIG